MITKLTTAVAMLLLVSSVAVAQTNQSNRYLVQDGTQNNRAQQMLNTGTISDSPAAIVNASKTNDGQAPQPTPQPNVGQNYFANQGCGCDGGCGGGYGGCDSGCNSGCGCNTGCNTGCCGGGGCRLGRGFGLSKGCEEYWRIFGGFNELDDLTDANGGQLNFRDGYGMGIAFGDRINCNLRRELEFAYRNNSFDGVDAAGAPTGTGTFLSYSLMGNLLFDLDFIKLNNATTYAGGGIGAALIDGELDGGPSFDEYAFAYQFILGLEKDIRPGTKAFVEYRYFGTTEYLSTSDATYDAQNIFVGLQFRK